MASVTGRVATGNTTNTTSYASASFTPAANELLVVLVDYSATTVPLTPTLSDSQGLGMTRILVKAADNSGSALAVFVANHLAAASSMTVTLSPGASCTGANIAVVGVSGMTALGSAAVRQSGAIDKATDGGGSTTPFATLGLNCLTTNVVLCGGCDVGNNPSLMTPPTGFTQKENTGYTTPLIGCSMSSIDSGFTGSTVTSGGIVSGRWQYFAMELDTSGGGGGAATQQMLMLLGMGS